MIRVTAKLMLLSWVVLTGAEDRLQENENERFKTDIMKLLLSGTAPNADNMIELLSQFSKKSDDMNDAGLEYRQLRADGALLFQKLEACRENYPEMSKDSFNQLVYGSLLGEVLGIKNKPFEDALRHCNISEQLVDRLRADLSELEIFQEILVLIPKNNSSESPESEKSTQQPVPLASNEPSHRNIQKAAVENNLKLKLGDEWIPVEPKVSHLSHIYLGSSIYPILTEESRILDKDHTIPSPTTTEESLKGKNVPLDDLTYAHVSRVMPLSRMNRMAPTHMEIKAETQNSEDDITAKLEELVKIGQQEISLGDLSYAHVSRIVPLSQQGIDRLPRSLQKKVQTTTEGPLKEDPPELRPDELTYAHVSRVVPLSGTQGSGSFRQDNGFARLPRSLETDYETTKKKTKHNAANKNQINKREKTEKPTAEEPVPKTENSPKTMPSELDPHSFPSSVYDDFLRFMSGIKRQLKEKNHLTQQAALRKRRIEH